jgi:hypothetical protein
MGIAQIQAGKAYVSIYGDKSPLVLALQEMGPEIRKQGEMLAKIGAATSNNFSKSNVAIAGTSDRAAAAEAALQGMRAAANSVSSAAQMAMVQTETHSKITADGVTKIVDRMNAGRPAAQGFAAAFSNLSAANVGLTSGAFGVSTLLSLLKAAGPAAQPLLSALTNISGQAGSLAKLKPVLPTGSGSAGMDMKSLARSAGGSAPMPASNLSRITKAISTGAMAAMGGLQPMFEMIKAGGQDAITKLQASERALFALGAAGGVVHGSLDGAFKTLVNGSKLAAVIGVNVIGGLAGVRGAFAPVFGQMTALQRAANSAQWATLFAGSKQQRKIAKQMGLEADAAAIGEAFARGWIPGFAKYIRLGVPRALFAGIRGAASLPGMAISGMISLARGKGPSEEISRIGQESAAAMPRVNLLAGALDKVNRIASRTTSIFGATLRTIGAMTVGGLSAMASIGRMGGNHSESASNKALEIGASATSQRRSVGSTAELAFGADATGTNLKTVDSAMDHFKSTVKQANDGSEKSIDLMNKLGVSAEKLAGMSTDQAMAKLGQALNRIKDPAERDRMAIEALGESGADLVPLLTDLEGFRSRARASGSLLTEKDVAAAKQMQLAMSQLKATLSNAWNTIGAASVKSTTAWIEGAAKFITKNEGLVGTLMKVAAGIVGAAGAFVVWDHLGGPVMTLMRGLGVVVAALTSPIGLVAVALGAAIAAWMYFTESGNKAASYLGSVFKQFYRFFNEVWGGIVSAVKKGDLALAAQIAWAGVKLAFFQSLKAIGGSFTAFMKTVYSLAKIFSDVWAGVWAGMKKGWSNAQGFIANGIIRLIGLSTGKSDQLIEQEIAESNRDTEMRNKNADEGRKAAFEKNEKLLEERLAALKTDDARIAELKAEMAQMISQAKQAEMSPDKKPADIGTPEFGSASSAKSSSQAGTFSAIAAVGLGGGNVMDKIERNTAETTVALKKIASSKGKKMVFGGGAGF